MDSKSTVLALAFGLLLTLVLGVLTAGILTGKLAYVSSSRITVPIPMGMDWTNVYCEVTAVRTAGDIVYIFSGANFQGVDAYLGGGIEHFQLNAISNMQSIRSDWWGANFIARKPVYGPNWVTSACRAKALALLHN